MAGHEQEDRLARVLRLDGSLAWIPAMDLFEYGPCDVVPAIANSMSLTVEELAGDLHNADFPRA